MEKVIYNFEIKNINTGLTYKHHLWEEEYTDAGEERAHNNISKIYLNSRVKLYTIEKENNKIY